MKSLIHKQLSLITKTRIRGLDAFNKPTAASAHRLGYPASSSDTPASDGVRQRGGGAEKGRMRRRGGLVEGGGTSGGRPAKEDRRHEVQGTWEGGSGSVRC